MAKPRPMVWASPLLGSVDAVMSDQSLDDLLTIFTIKKKSDLKKHCRSITIFQSDLANLIWTCMGDGPFLHQAYHRDFVPEHLVLTNDDLGAFVANGVGVMQPRAKKTANKISAMFDERRLLSGHMFLGPEQSQWHLFYFDQRDFTERNNHWEGGSHIHLINNLWPGRTAEQTWQEFRTGNPQMRGALHIRFNRTVRFEPEVLPADSEFASGRE
jgi:hypothetical protein